MSRVDDKPGRRRLGVGRLLLVFLFLLFVVGAGIFVAWQRRGAAQVAALLAQLKAEGEPITAAEMEAYYRLPVGREDCTQLYLTAVAALDGPAFASSVLSLPLLGNSASIPPPPGQPWEDLETVETFLAQHEQSLDLLHEAARRGGGCRYPTNFSQGFAMLLPDVQKIRNAARMLQLQALVRAHRGDAHGAAESLRAMWRAGETLEFKPITISQLVRVSIGSLAIGQFEDFVPVVDFSDDDLRMLQAEFRGFDPKAAVARSIRGSRAMGFHAIENYIDIDFEPRPSPVSRLLLNAEKAYYLEQMARLVKASAAPGPLARSEVIRVEADIDFDLSRGGWRQHGKTMTTHLMPALGASTDAFYHAAARSATVDAAIAAELFRRRHGRPPATLDELLPDFLPSVPLDPFDGLPLRMTSAGDQLLIYSVGPNLTNDGGKEDKREGTPDVVFRMKLKGATKDE